MSKKVEPIQVQEAMEIVNFMRKRGVVRFELGDLKVVFAAPGPEHTEKVDDGSKGDRGQ